MFFSPSVYTYFPLPPRQRAAVAIHDAIADRHPALTLPTRRARAFWRAKVALALHQADLVLTVSDFAAGELTEVLGVRPSRIRVTGEAAAAVFQPSEDPEDIARAARGVGLPPHARWFTYVGGFNPHKRVEDIVRTFAQVARTSQDPPPHLVLVGNAAGDVFLQNTRAVHAAIAEHGIADLVHWAGVVPDADLRHLHSGAMALLMFSECEGFGLPAVEAAACGTAVIATTASPLPQLLAGGGLFVQPGDTEALQHAMRALATDEPRRRALAACARARAAVLTWDAAARRTLEALREVAT